MERSRTMQASTEALTAITLAMESARRSEVAGSRGVLRRDRHQPAAPAARVDGRDAPAEGRTGVRRGAGLAGPVRLAVPGVAGGHLARIRRRDPRDRRTGH